ncbi:hypothetical protein N0V94_002151 [Neodidymelliopsis sp. IMI 364377]|nr:hypothetical protein N0V94_002151 [Neodidymelliopsis sp. IMI 364377]
MMRKRDRLRALFSSDTTQPAPTYPPAQQTAPPQTPLPSSSQRPAVSSSVLPTVTTVHSLVLEKALTQTLKKIPESEKAAFEQASKTIDERTVISSVKSYDDAHKNDSSFRPRAERLSKFLNLLNRFMGGVAIGIQASPEISALVVGSVRVVIDLALKFTLYFSRLTDMLCIFEDYLGPLADYAKAADTVLVEKTVVNAYANIVNLGWKARRVFVDANGDQRKWTSLRAFMRQHWETFESEFGTIREDIQHQLDILLHSVQSLHYDFSRKTEQARQRDEYNSSSTVIEDTTKKIGLRGDAALCFAYYNYRDTQLHELHQVVAALIKQLCQKRAELPHDLLQTKHDALSPSLVGTQDRFLSLVEDLSEVYVVFDALDECPEREREAIIGFITGIVTAKIECQVKVFVTSRKEMDIAKAFEDKHIPTVQIQTENVTADIEAFVRGQIEKLLAGENGRTLYITDDGLKEKIAQTLASKAEGMFLWVNLQLDSLCQASKARKDRIVEAALDALPQGLSETYVRILVRIESQDPYMRDLALNCLTWTIYARRPLRTWELQHALAINSKCTTLEDLQIDSSQVILEACGNLLEEVNGSIRPIHYTVQEFFTTTVQGPSQHNIHAQLLDSNSVHKRLSLACFEFVKTMAFDGPVDAEFKLSQRLRDNKFAAYGEYYGTALQLASRYRYEQIVKLLLDNKAEINAQDREYSSALQAASHYGHEQIVKLLLDNKAEGRAYSTALQAASEGGHEQIVKLLLDHKADVDGGTGNYALQRVIARGHGQVVKLLLDHKADVQGDNGGLAVLKAGQFGHEQVVKLLLDYKADVQGKYGKRALRLALKEGHEQIVKLLRDAGADEPEEDDLVSTCDENAISWIWE